MSDDHRDASMHGIPPPAERAARRRLAVLLVDPNWEEIRLLADAVARECDLAVVRTAQDAFATLSARTPDLIVTELDLPDSAGVQFLARVHTAPTTYHVLLLVMTRRNSVRDKIAAFQAGADDYLVKPVDPRDFVQHLQLLSRFQRVIGKS